MRFDELGTLEKVNVRDAWDSESKDFTPWLADNLEKMGHAIGIDLELVTTEMAVGRYRADIVARASNGGTRVLIENQLGEADLQHLGQVLAYLAGLDAKAVVWVATSFKGELLAAIRWLNDYTPAPFKFFAVEVGIVRIGDSLPAPVFDVLERPNEWERAVESKVGQREYGEFGQLRSEFWQHYNERYQDEDDVEITEGTWSAVYWPAADDMKVNASITQRGVAMYVQLPDLQDEKALERMESCLDTISEILADEEVLLRQYSNQWCKTILKIDTKDRDNWDQMIDWLEERRKVYLDVVRDDQDDQNKE